MVNRSRACTNPTPTPDGKPCSGDAFQTKLECIWPCPSKLIPSFKRFLCRDQSSVMRNECITKVNLSIFLIVNSKLITSSLKLLAFTF